MSSTEGMYQLKPVGRGSLWWSIIGLALVLLLLPVGINAVVPEQRNSYQPLIVGSFGYEWEVPVVTEADAPVMCEMTTDELLMKYWECNGDTTVVTMMVEDVEDPANSLRRMVRAGLTTQVSDDIPAVSSEDGRSHAMYVPGESVGEFVNLPIVAVSQRGEGDYEHLTAVAIINGFSNDYYATHIWSSMAKERGLPYGQEFPLEMEGSEDPFNDSPFGELPWDELPWEDLLNEPEGVAPDNRNNRFGDFDTDLQEETA
ncbi:hypothetical protein [Corynebacterium faecale]|uniref:hypothetical protein n=1 Tax=Corynebacterium faecale TaxID=1758466 RepID=UPI0025B33835|nr:hypothetical protein [Corynebacterium faecale]